MLFMTVYTYEPHKRDEVVRRRAEKGPLLPDGLKALGEWSYIGGGRVFRLFEGEDAAAAFRAGFAWSDLGKVEIYPVLETDKIMQLVKGK